MQVISPHEKKKKKRLHHSNKIYTVENNQCGIYSRAYLRFVLCPSTTDKPELLMLQWTKEMGKCEPIFLPQIQKKRKNQKK